MRIISQFQTTRQARHVSSPSAQEKGHSSRIRISNHITANVMMVIGEKAANINVITHAMVIMMMVESADFVTETLENVSVLVVSLDMTVKLELRMWTVQPRV